jgi:hypothetical protein
LFVVSKFWWNPIILDYTLKLLLLVDESITKPFCIVIPFSAFKVVGKFAHPVRIASICSGLFKLIRISAADGLAVVLIILGYLFPFIKPFRRYCSASMVGYKKTIRRITLADKSIFCKVCSLPSNQVSICKISKVYLPSVDAV